jgi:hypothetical protein
VTEIKKEKILETKTSKTLQYSDSNQILRRNSFMPTCKDNRLAPIASFETIDSLSNIPTLHDNIATATDFLQVNKTVTRSKSDLASDNKKDSKNKSSFLSIEKILNSSKTFDQISEKNDSIRINSSSSSTSSISSLASVCLNFM